MATAAKNGKAKAAPNQREVIIAAPAIETVVYKVIGTAPLVIHKFSQKMKEQMKAKQEAGSQAGKGKKREPKNFQEAYEQSLYRSPDGWYGIPATAFRNAMINACRMAGFKMTHARCSIFIEADGWDADGSTPLVKIAKGKPEYFESMVRLETGVADIRVRGRVAEGWVANVKVRYDADQFSIDDVTNLLMRAGMQVGLLEGRPFSTNGGGMGWGTFTVES